MHQKGMKYTHVIPVYEPNNANSYLHGKDDEYCCEELEETEKVIKK